MCVEKRSKKKKITRSCSHMELKAKKNSLEGMGKKKELGGNRE